MDNAMFCWQCEQTAGGKGCTKIGVCSKDPDVAKMQDVLIYLLKGIGFYATKNIEKGNKIPREIGEFFTECVFATLTNVNFDGQRFVKYIKEANKVKKQLKESAGQIENVPKDADFIAPETRGEILNIASRPNLGVMDDENLDMDIRSLREFLIYGIKGMGAYHHHAYVLGKYDEEVANFMFKAMGATLDRSLTVENYFDLNMECGKTNLKCMALLDAGNTGTFGDPEPTQMLITKKKGPFIVVSGHDLRDLGDLLEQSKDKGVNIYTHGEMLPCNAYPGLKKYPHLIGNFGGAWQDQQKEFDGIPGAILMTSNCLMKPRDSYKDRIFTSSIVGWPGVQHIETVNGKKDFSPVINKALELGGFPEDEPEKRIPMGFGRNALLSNAGAIVDAVKAGKIRHFFLIGGCDGARPGRNYYTEFAEKTPKDTIILTLACGKYRFNKLDLGTVAGFPRILDCGQCNDAYTAIQVALALAEAFDCDVNDLPLSFIISWYEQKAVAVLQTMLYLGLQDIYLGPSLPAFVTPNILQVLVDKFNIKPISTPDEDLKVILG
ncbi:hydroxylamine reductase [Paramaledivibacter caminithermalis]|jgi:hydroxylamine reductase|uniref:Hydroxylamine reductase n=1 Tax=Paramaledivibacter caminithermalis (strain DSM 15212 / CIP 107654 / DViRD3) TaxID=1121301 RepID=A0A1M6T5J5_PARC5|nr:hydroxylamine reductase [Paramaledivibacter caminithermalis]SHK52210.1 hydroxylamine reductase [Paramaledivibacter caminithermalis DSM 15212]